MNLKKYKNVMVLTVIVMAGLGVWFFQSNAKAVDAPPTVDELQQNDSTLVETNDSVELDVDTQGVENDEVVEESNDDA